MELVLAHVMAGGAADIVTRVSDTIATGVLPPPDAFSRSPLLSRVCLCGPVLPLYSCRVNIYEIVVNQPLPS